MKFQNRRMKANGLKENCIQILQFAVDGLKVGVVRRQLIAKLLLSLLIACEFIQCPLPYKSAHCLYR